MPPRRYKKRGYKKRYPTLAQIQSARRDQVRRYGPAARHGMLHYKGRGGGSHRGSTHARGYKAVSIPRRNPTLKLQRRTATKRGGGLIPASPRVTLRYIEMHGATTAEENDFDMKIPPIGYAALACNVPSKVQPTLGVNDQAYPYGYGQYQEFYRAERCASSKLKVHFTNPSNYSIIVYIYVRSADLTTTGLRSKESILRGPRCVWGTLAGHGSGTDKSTTLNIAWNIKDDRGPAWQAAQASEGDLPVTQWNATHSDMGSTRTWYYQIGAFFTSPTLGSPVADLLVPLEITMDFDMQFRDPIAKTANDWGA